MARDYSLRAGGVGPVPGSNEAKAEGCPCLGALGGWDPRYIVLDKCPLHGVEARRKHRARARNEMRAGLGLPPLAEQGCVVISVFEGKTDKPSMNDWMREMEVIESNIVDALEAGKSVLIEPKGRWPK